MPSPDDPSDTETAKITKKPKIQEKDITGLKYFDKLAPMLERLHRDGCSLGSLSEATSVFEAERLKEIIAELGDQLQPLAQDKRLSDIQQTITLVDGSLIAALPNIMEAPLRKAADGNGIRINPHTSRHRVR